MRTEFRIKKMTEKEVLKLPFPHAARAIGGIIEPVIVYDSAKERREHKAKIKQLRKEWEKMIASSR